MHLILFAWVHVCVCVRSCTKRLQSSVRQSILPEDVNTFLVFCKNAYVEEAQLERLSVVKLTV